MSEELTALAAEAEERKGGGVEKPLATAILTVIKGEKYRGEDPGEKYRRSAKTPNQRVLRIVAGYAVASQRKDVALRDLYRDELVAYGENQREIGFQCSDTDNPEAWNLCEMFTSTHDPQWGTAYYGAIWCGLEFHDEIVLGEGEWFLAAQLYFYAQVDPLQNVDPETGAGFRSGRVVMACARAQGTEGKGETKPYIVETKVRNEVWRMACGMKREQHNKTRLETAQDYPNILERCRKRGWEFPLPPADQPRLYACFLVTVDGPIVETRIIASPNPQIVADKAVEHTRYDLASGEVEMIREPIAAEA